jgi:hypothetical protein
MPKLSTILQKLTLSFILKKMLLFFNYITLFIQIFKLLIHLQIILSEHILSEHLFTSLSSK